MNLPLGLTISFISGLSTMLGLFIIFINFKDKNKIIAKCLIFSSAIMLYISITDLLPSSYSYIRNYYSDSTSLILISLYILFGFIIVEIIDRNNNSKDSLYKIGIISMIALIIHNIPEGIITFITTSKDIKLGIHFALSIALHNIPEGIAIAVPIFYSTKSKRKAILYTLFASIQEPLGAILAYLFFPNINNYLFSIILSTTAGIMIYLSIFDLLDKSREYTNIKDIIKKYILSLLLINILKLFI